MSQDHAPRAAAPGSAWLRPWRVLLIALGVVTVAALLVVFENQYQITDATLAAMPKPPEPPAPVKKDGDEGKEKEPGEAKNDEERRSPAIVSLADKLERLKGKPFKTRREFESELKKVLDPEE